MLKIIIPILALLSSGAQEPWAEHINPNDPMSYIVAAEDISAKQNFTGKQRRLVTELYVLAAVADSSYRESSITGILSLVTEEDVASRLNNLSNAVPILVPSVVPSKQDSHKHGINKDEKVLEAIALLREGKMLSVEHARVLRPWSFLYSDNFIKVIDEAVQKKRELTSSEVWITLKIELAVLGGASLWSADYAATGGKPVVVSMTTNLAELLGVDPTKLYRKNGMWVSE